MPGAIDGVNGAQGVGVDGCATLYNDCESSRPLYVYLPPPSSADDDLVLSQVVSAAAVPLRCRAGAELLVSALQHHQKHGDGDIWTGGRVAVHLSHEQPASEDDEWQPMPQPHASDGVCDTLFHRAVSTSDSKPQALFLVGDQATQSVYFRAALRSLCACARHGVSGGVSSSSTLPTGLESLLLASCATLEPLMHAVRLGQGGRANDGGEGGMDHSANGQSREGEGGIGSYSQSFVGRATPIGGRHITLVLEKTSGHLLGASVQHFALYAAPLARGVTLYLPCLMLRSASPRTRQQLQLPNRLETGARDENDVEDSEDGGGAWGRWLRALRAIGLPEAAVGDVERLVAAMVHLSRIRPRRSADHSFAVIDGDEPPGAGGDPEGGAAPLRTCASMLGVGASGLASALTSRQLDLPAADADAKGVHMPLTTSESHASCGLLLALLQQRLRAWLHGKVDAALAAASALSTTGSAQGVRVSLVHSPGFEREQRFAGSGGECDVDTQRDGACADGGGAGLDVLIANLCAEKQNAFLLSALRAQPGSGGPPSLADGTAVAHGAPLPVASGPSQGLLEAAESASREVLGLIEGIPRGLLATIDHHSRTPAHASHELCASLQAAHRQNPRWGVQPGAFSVRHSSAFLGGMEEPDTSAWATVAYPVHGMLAAAKHDEACARLMGCRADGSAGVVQQLTRLLRSSSVRLLSEDLMAEAEDDVLAEKRPMAAGAPPPHSTRAAAGWPSRALRCGQARRQLSQLFASFSTAGCTVVACAAVPSGGTASVRSSQLHFLCQLRSFAPLIAAARLSEAPCGKPPPPSEGVAATSSPAACAANTSALRSLSEERGLDGGDLLHGGALELHGQPMPNEQPPPLRGESGDEECVAAARSVGIGASRRMVEASLDGQQILTSLLELRTWSQRGPRWAPLLCTLLSDDELMLLHTEHPPYAASISTALLTRVTLDDEAANKPTEGATIIEEAADAPSAISPSPAADRVAAPSPAADRFERSHATLHVWVRERELVLRHHDRRMLERWERTLSARARLNQASQSQKVRQPPQWAAGSQDPHAQAEGDEDARVPWKAGPVRLAAERIDSSGHLKTVPCLATLTHDCVLRIQPSAVGGSGETQEEKACLELALAQVLSVRILPPYQPILEIAVAATPATTARTLGSRPAPPPSSRHLLCFASEEELLSWMGTLLLLLPTCKPAHELTRHSKPQQPLPIKEKRASVAPQKRFSLAVNKQASAVPGGRLTKRAQSCASTPSAATPPSRGKAGPMAVAGGAMLPEEPAKPATSDVRVAGAVRVLTTMEDGASRWLACHGRLEADGTLTLRSVDAFEMRRCVPVRVARSLMRLGPPRAPYLSLEMPTGQPACVLQPLGGVDAAMAWAEELKLGSGLTIVSAVASGWARLRFEALTDQGTAQHVYDGRQEGRAAAATPERAFLVLTSSHSLLWFHSDHEPTPFGSLDMRACTVAWRARSGASSEEAVRSQRDYGREAAPAIMLGVDLLTSASTPAKSLAYLHVLGPFTGTGAHEWHGKLQSSIEACKQLEGLGRAADKRSHRVSSGAGRLSLSRLRGWSRMPPARPPQTMDHALTEGTQGRFASAASEAPKTSPEDRSWLLADSSAATPPGNQQRDKQMTEGSLSHWLCLWCCGPFTATNTEPSIQAPLLKQAGTSVDHVDSGIPAQIHRA